jgi:hypothetical protein
LKLEVLGRMERRWKRDERRGTERKRVEGRGLWKAPRIERIRRIFEALVEEWGAVLA